MRQLLVIATITLCWVCYVSGGAVLPIVVNTWPFTAATEKAWEVLSTTAPTANTSRALDAIEQGVHVCELEQCDGTVGFGGSPDENGETTLDALIMDGTSMDAGAVSALREIKAAITTARYVMEHTELTMLAGSQATDFAVMMGLERENLSTPQSIQEWEQWKNNSCQPNYWTDVTPDPAQSCGPYKPLPVPKQDVLKSAAHVQQQLVKRENHDTIAMVIVDENQNVVAGCSTNGLSHKIPGRVGDGPIIGAGAYADSTVGGCGETGDGDVMMRFLPTFRAVENMRLGMSPKEAAEDAIRRVRNKFPHFIGAIVCVNINGDYGGAAWGWTFTFSVRSPAMSQVEVITVPPLPN